MRLSSILIATVSTAFGAYLCYLGQYDAGAAMFGAAVAALALSPDNSNNTEIQELKTRVILLEQELQHQREIAQSNTQIALLESRLERLDQPASILPESTIEVEEEEQDNEQ